MGNPWDCIAKTKHFYIEFFTNAEKCKDFFQKQHFEIQKNKGNFFVGNFKKLQFNNSFSTATLYKGCDDATLFFLGGMAKEGLIKPHYSEFTIKNTRFIYDMEEGFSFYQEEEETNPTMLCTNPFILKGEEI